MSILIFWIIIYFVHLCIDIEIWLIYSFGALLTDTFLIILYKFLLSVYHYLIVIVDLRNKLIHP